MITRFVSVLNNQFIDLVKVQILINDQNDNPPAFNSSKFEGRVNENAEIDSPVMKITAKDIDKCIRCLRLEAFKHLDSSLRYSLESDSDELERIPFGVKTETGVIFVKEALDFETKERYDLRLKATDGRFNASTLISIYLNDVNDQPPIFDQSGYETSIFEEDSNVPRTLFVIRARDPDKLSDQPIVYGLEGQGVGEFFTVDRLSGEIQVLKALDRDPPSGVPRWEFVVTATDEGGLGLVSYANVRVYLKGECWERS